VTATVGIPCLSLVLGVKWFSNGLVQKHILLSYLCQSFRESTSPNLGQQIDCPCHTTDTKDEVCLKF
jgi:hypothetical protein